MSGLLFFPMSVSAVLNWVSYYAFWFDLPHDLTSSENFFVVLGNGIILTVGFGLTNLLTYVPARFVPRKTTIQAVLVGMLFVSGVLLFHVSFDSRNLYPPVNLNDVPCPTASVCPYSNDLTEILNEINAENSV